jgi:hypothetical protein
MITYSQFCSVAKAAEVFGDRWTTRPSLRRDARVRDHPLPQRRLLAREIGGRLGRPADRFAAVLAEALHDVALAQGFGEIRAEADRDGARGVARQEGADPRSSLHRWSSHVLLVIGEDGGFQLPQCGRWSAAWCPAM